MFIEEARAHTQKFLLSLPLTRLQRSEYFTILNSILSSLNMDTIVEDSIEINPITISPL